MSFHNFGIFLALTSSNFVSTIPSLLPIASILKRFSLFSLTPFPQCFPAVFLSMLHVDTHTQICIHTPVFQFSKSLVFSKLLLGLLVEFLILIFIVFSSGISKQSIFIVSSFLKFCILSFVLSRGACGSGTSTSWSPCVSLSTTVYFFIRVILFCAWIFLCVRNSLCTITLGTI